MKTAIYTFSAFLVIFSLSNQLMYAQIFTDITESAGVLGLQKFLGHGVLFADITEDGLPDLLITNIGGREIVPNLLFINQGNGKFIEDGKKRGAWNINLIDKPDKDWYVRKTKTFDPNLLADLKKKKGWFGRGTHGSVFADLDNDGDYDLVNATTDIRIYFHRNEGKGYFTDVTEETGITSKFIATRGVTAFDADGDGDLDIFGNNGWQSVEKGNIWKNEFYINEGNFKFRQVDQGLAGPFGGQGVTDIDLDLDSDVDLLLGRKDVLFENDGKGNFTPRDLGLGYQPETGFSVADFDNDGDFDLGTTNDIKFRESYEVLFFRQVKPGVFEKTQVLPSGRGGSMGHFGDLDNDGDMDFYPSGSSWIFLNDGKGNFTPKTNCGMTAHQDDPRGCAMADIDNDGDLDIMSACKRSLCIMYRNDYNGKNNWIKVSVTSPSGTKGGFGSIVRIYKAGKEGEKKYLLGMQAISSNEGYLGQSDPVLHFGLGKNKTVDVEVTFVGGSKKVLKKQKANQMLRIKG